MDKNKKSSQLSEEMKSVGDDLKKSTAEIGKEVKEKFKSMGVLKLIVLLILIIGTVLTFVFYNKVFAADSVFQTTVVTKSDFLTKVLRGIPTLIKSLQIVTIAVTAISILLAFIRHFFGRRTKRGKTVKILICNLIKWVSAIVLVIVVLAVWGVNTTALITGAGVVTLIVGLGMQSLIADVVAGLFIVFENDFNVGDIITVDGFRGEVVSIGIRTTKLEALGNVKIINNSDLRSVLNQTIKPSTAVANIGVSYDDLYKVESVIEKCLSDVKVEGVIGNLSYEGVKELANSKVILLFTAKCQESDIFGVQRRMNRELKFMFDENGIKMPYEHLVVMQGEESEASDSDNKESAEKVKSE